MEQSHGAGAEAGRDESLSARLSLVTDPTEHAAGVLAGLGDQGVVLQEGPRGARGRGGGGLLPGGEVGVTRRGEDRWWGARSLETKNLLLSIENRFLQAACTQY